MCRGRPPATVTPSERDADSSEARGADYELGADPHAGGGEARASQRFVQVGITFQCSATRIVVDFFKRRERGRQGLGSVPCAKRASGYPAMFPILRKGG